MAGAHIGEGVQMKARVTIREVAEQAGVSISTVSRVFNGVQTVDPALVKKIKKAAERLSYVPNPAGRALRLQRSDIWAVIVSDLQNPFYTQMVANIENVAAQHGFGVMLSTSEEDIKKERRQLIAAVSQRMAGVIISPASESQTDLSILTEAHIPVVVVDRNVKSYRGSSVVVDNNQVGWLAANHLVENGYVKPLLISSSKEVSSAHGRRGGFVRALADQGIEIPDKRVYSSDLRFESGRDAVIRALNENSDVDSIFTVNGPLTAAAFGVLKELNIQIPRDIALMGVDDEQWTSMVTPSVSVIRQPVAEIGKRAGQMLAQANNNDLPYETVVLHPQLIVRDSTVPRNMHSEARY
ncbi:MAG: LacI family transcriptional regulator [Arcanobacterium sp.]|nr:LacI family transcriptional regulator [Arcanobacterium sp.]MDY5589157.1 LacI family DNA-binding transcriptional regulator [Arcanobacterium sp.]